MITLQILLWLYVTQTVYTNFYFATHNSYRSFSYNINSTETLNLAGNVITVTQQCRRLCSMKSYCKAYSLTLISGLNLLGNFECQFYSENSCDWRNVSLQNATTSLSTNIWDKLEATNSRAKACIEYCQVKYRGNCTACRGYEGLIGLDCDIAPRLCEDYRNTSLGWKTMPIWPWGFYRRKLSVVCLNLETTLIRNLDTSTNIRMVYALGADDYQSINNMTDYTKWIDSINWPLLAEVQSISKSKHFCFRVYYGGKTLSEIYTGLELGPDGSLSLNGSLTSPPSGHFPVPISQAPFVYQPPGYGVSCGAFWWLDNNTNICNFRTHLLNLKGVCLNGTFPTSASAVSLTFV